MKKILPFLFILASYTATAQIVNIPDPVFKNYLLSLNPSIDLNLDGEIQVSEAATVNFLYMNSINVTDLTGIRSFANLNQLTLSNLPLLTSIDISGINNLAQLSLSQMPLVTVIDISGINNLTQLLLSQMPLATVINTTGVKAMIVEIHQVAATSLDMSSFTTLTFLNIIQTQISSLDLTACTALSNATIFGNPQLSSLNVSGITTLSRLSCNNNNLSSLNITGATGIINLDCSVNHLTSLNLPGFINLRTLYCGSNNITSLNIHGLSSLEYLHCSDNNLTSLTFSNCPLLREFVCGNENYFTSLDLSNGLPGLVTANCINMPSLTSINLANCPNLQSVVCHGTSVSSLDLSGKQFLTGVVCFNAALANINLTGCTALAYLDVSGNHLTMLDCSSSQALTNFGAENNQLTYLNIKNGSTLDLSNNLFRATGNPGLQYVCTDDNEVNAIQNYFIQNGMSNVNINSYCSFTPGGSYNTISGTIKLDNNNNGCDVSDPVLPQQIIKINDGTNVGYASSNDLGAYSFYTNAGNYTITPQTTNPYFTISPASASINFATAGGNTQAANFCFAPNGVHNDLDITIIPIGFARPGFDATYQLVYKNKGTTTLSGNVELIFDDARVDLTNANPAASTQSTNLLNWTYANLSPFESRTINIVFHLLPPPDNNLNDTLNLTANITPLAGDGTPGDNSFIMRQIIQGSFDPNDKTCLEGAGILITDVGDYAHYLIRFQNTGTDTAFNVVIKDILTNKFDWNSFEVTKTSHPFVLRQTAGNKLEFIFENINLPDSNVNEPASHGFIAFKIKTIPTLVLGDSIKNNASIYFDFNLPVVTNTATSYIVSDIIVPVSMEYFRGYKQSGNHLLNWKANCTSMKLTFDIERSIDGMNYNSLTSITASNTRCLQPFDFTDNNPVAGINYYRIKMTDIDGKISYSNVIALLNKNAGFEIVNLTPNPVVGGNAFLNITSAEKQMINIRVTDASGKIVQTINETVIPGFTQLQMNFSKLASGIYTIIIHTGDGERKTIRFVKE